MRKTTIIVVQTLCLALVVAGGIACPRQPEEAKVTTLLTADAANLKAEEHEQENEVPLEDIQSLTVTVTKIVLDYAGDSLPDGAQDEEK